MFEIATFESFTQLYHLTIAMIRAAREMTWNVLINDINNCTLVEVGQHLSRKYRDTKIYLRYR